jgi:hypothetical protein
LFTGLTVNAVPLQTVVVRSWIEGLGLTVTVTVNVGPVQDPDVGVTVYVAVCVVLVGLVNVPVIDEPDPVAPPVKPPVIVGAFQVYVVPAGMIVVVGVTAKVPPVHIVAV